MVVINVEIDLTKFGIETLTFEDRFLIKSNQFPNDIQLDVYCDEKNESYASTSTIYENGDTFFIFGKALLVDSDYQQESIGHLTLDNGEQKLVIYWLDGCYKILGNPMELRYVALPEGDYQFNITNINLGSKSQLVEIWSHRNLFMKLINFKQAQRGGRKKGVRSKKTKNRYTKILQHRYCPEWRLRTDKEFLEAFSDKYNRSLLQRAKKWDAEGKP